MKRPAWAVLIAAMLALLLAGVPGAQAATAPAAAGVGPARGSSYSIWTINGTTVHLRFILPIGDARGLDPAARGRPDAASAAAAVAAGVSVRSTAGDCPEIVQSQWVGRIYTLALKPGLYRYEVIFECPSGQVTSLHDGVLFANVPGHVNYARIQIAGGRPVMQTFTRDRQTLELPAGGSAPRGAGVLGFARQGMTHLLGQADRLCVLGALLLLARRWRDLAEIAAALGLGYLVSLAVALNGSVVADPALSAATIGLLAALVGACAMRMETFAPVSRTWKIGTAIAAGLVGAGALAMAALRGWPTGLAAAGLAVFALAQLWLVGVQPRVRWVLFAPATLLGLLDGLGPARDLALLDLPPFKLLPAFVGYDLGGLATAAALAGIAMAVLWLAGRRLRSAQKIAVDLAAAGLIGVGMFWFVSRLYG